MRRDEMRNGDEYSSPSRRRRNNRNVSFATDEARYCQYYTYPPVDCADYDTSDVTRDLLHSTCNDFMYSYPASSAQVIPVQQSVSEELVYRNSYGNDSHGAYYCEHDVPTMSDTQLVNVAHRNADYMDCRKAVNVAKSSCQTIDSMLVNRRKNYISNFIFDWSCLSNKSATFNRFVLLFVAVIALLVTIVLIVASLLYLFQIGYISYEKKAQIEETRCEKMFCDFGASCQIDPRTKNAFCKCDVHCKKDVFAPVCGSNNITYSNECQLRNASCSTQLRIFVRHVGECHLSDPCLNKQCQFGAVCQPSIDGRSSECVCTDKCQAYADSRAAREVCGSDGKDYPNFCELKKSACIQMKEITAKYYGRCDPCEGIECPSSQVCQLDEHRNAICRCSSQCSTELKPVCGSNGKTYTNECLIRAESCRVQQHLRIIKTEPCSADVLSNPCNNLKCKANQECNIDRFGVASCICPLSCPPIMKPVCGSDGSTYDSECDLQRESCLNETEVSVVHRSACDSEEHLKCQKVQCEFGSQCLLDPNSREPRCVCMFSCSAEYNPVCGSDGISYNNLCQLRKQSCEHKKAIHVAFSGLCGGCENKICQFYSLCETDGVGQSKCVCPETCVPVNDLVCGSDGKTYSNECEMKVVACKQQKYITVVSKGSCDLCRNIHCKYGARCEDGHCICPTVCPEEKEPLCATDGSTYANECEMRKFACESNLELGIRFYGECIKITTVTDDEESSKERKVIEGSGDDDADDNYIRTCKDLTCNFGSKCEETVKGQPKCVCSFNCDASNSTTLICGNDGIFYENECFLKLAECEKGKELAIVSPDTCKATTTAVTNCRTHIYGCCPDGKTASQGPKFAGCPTTCGCNRLGSYSMSCDPISKQCPCKPGVGGLKCDRCEPGFWGLHKISEGNSGCIHCSCNELGSVRDDCEQTTGRCVCKDGVLGMKCDHCSPQEVLTVDGCVFAANKGQKRKTCEELVCTFGAVCKDDSRSASCVCNFDCEDSNLIPVCGSDNNTYGSECQMKLFSCRYQKAISIINEGSCQPQMPVTPLPSPPLMLSTAPETSSYSSQNPLNMSTLSVPQTMSTSGNAFIKPPYLKMMRLNGFVRFTIEVEFQTFTENGIILYNAQSVSGKGDFVSIAIRNGHIEFKFNLGSGPVLLRSHRKIDLQTRVKVVARRYLRDGKLSVSGQEDVTNKSHGTMKNLDLGDYLYLANVPTEHKRTMENIGVRNGLFGCILSLKIDSKNIDLRNYSFKFSKLNKKLITENQTSLCFCDFNCENAFLEPVCGTDFNVYKSECALKVASCETQRTIHVNNYGTCDDQMIDNPSNQVLDTESDNKTATTTHQFQRDSEFLAATSPRLETMKILSGFAYFKLPKIEAKHGLMLEIVFQAFSENGIILYNGQSASGNGDFVSLSLRDGRIEFRYNLGSGIALLQSRQKIDLGSDVTVFAKRHLRDGRLTVIGQKDVVGKSPGSMKSLDLGDHLYLGNVPESEQKIYENVGVDTGFVGHLMKFKLGARNMDLRKVPLKSLTTKNKSKMSSLVESKEVSS